MQIIHFSDINLFTKLELLLEYLINKIKVSLQSDATAVNLTERNSKVYNQLDDFSCKI